VPLRRLIRAAPFVLGAVAVLIWLRRRQPQRQALGEPPRTLAPRREQLAPGRPQPAGEPASVDIVTVVDDLLDAPH
jgi:hypothetical protein